MKRGKYTILVFDDHDFHSRVLVVKLVAGFSGDPVSFGLEYLDGRRGGSGGMAEYYIEIPSSPSVDRFGGGCGTFDKRFADADDFPQPAGGAVRVGYQLGGKSRRGLSWCCFPVNWVGWH